jgi:hypothetical protein
MTVREIVQAFLIRNNYDGLHSHATNNRYGGCGCGISKLMKNCGFQCDDCEPAYKHTKKQCEQCKDKKKCEPFSEGERFMYCGKPKCT